MTIWANRLWIHGRFVESRERRPTLSPYLQKVVSETHQLAPGEMAEVVAASAEAFNLYRKTSAFARSRLLALMAEGLVAQRHELCQRITAEAGKPWTLSDIEVSRAVQTFTIAAEEAKRLGGEVVPLAQDLGARAYGPALSYFEPRGPVLAITPFNFPLNLVAHKLAPALAVGASVLLKPPPQAPGAAVLLAEIFAAAAQAVSRECGEDIPLTTLQVVHGANDTISKAVTDPRIAVLSFTGSDTVGWHLQSLAVRKRVALELGGNAAVIINADADIARAASRCAFGAFAYAGQICISVQKIFVHQDIAAAFRERLLKETALLKVGNPEDRDCLVGPLIDQAAAERISQWLAAAIAGGARLLAGGVREGSFITPAVITGVDDQQPLACQEVFGPVVIVEEIATFTDGIRRTNASKFGLQAGLFTNDQRAIHQATRDLAVGGIIVNDVPTFRADNMPYGGIKDSGLGREGVRYAMEEFCERKTIVHWIG